MNLKDFLKIILFEDYFLIKDIKLISKDQKSSYRIQRCIFLLNAFCDSSYNKEK